MVRALAQSAKGVGSSPIQHYSFLCVYMFASKEYSFIYSIKANEEINILTMMVDHLADVWNRCTDDQFQTDAWNRCTDEASRCKSPQMAVQKVKVPDNQTNKLSVVT